MAYVFANNVSTTLADAASSTTTTLTLTSSANLPTIPPGDYFAITLNDAATQSFFEIVYVTAISGANLTVLRGQEGTAARAWDVNDYAFAADTAGILSNFLQALNVEAPLSYSAGTLSISTPIAKAYGGTGTASPGEVAGSGISLSGTWPNQTIMNAGVVSLNSKTGALNVTGTGGATISESGSNVNVDTSGLIDDITSTDGSITVTPSGQSYNLEVGSGFVGQTIPGLFNPTPAEINATYSVELPSALGTGNWVIQIICNGFGIPSSGGNIEMTGTGGTYASSASLDANADSRTLVVAGTATSGQTPGVTLEGSNVQYAGGSTAIFLTIMATRIS